MLHEVLALAVLVALNPVLLAFTLLVISRPRTVPNLLAFWLGSLMVNVPAFLIALLAMHLVPSFADFAHSLATPDPQTSVRPVQVASGVVAAVSPPPQAASNKIRIMNRLHFFMMNLLLLQQEYSGRVFAG